MRFPYLKVFKLGIHNDLIIEFNKVVKISKTITISLSTSAIILAIVSLFIGYLLGNFIPFSKTTIQNTPSPSNPPNNPNVGNQPGIVGINIPSYVPFRGSDSAKINIIEFGDYQCPFCERFFSQVEPQIMQNYVNTGKAKFYFMDFAFLGPDSLTLAEGAWCANEQGLYYQYHDYIYSHQGPENSGWGTIDKVEAMASNISGLDLQKFSSCLKSHKYTSRVQELTQFGQSLGVGGTPTFFIGNDKIGYQVVVGAQPYNVFQQVIETQLSKV